MPHNKAIRVPKSNASKNSYLAESPESRTENNFPFLEKHFASGSDEPAGGAPPQSASGGATKTLVSGWKASQANQNPSITSTASGASTRNTS